MRISSDVLLGSYQFGPTQIIDVEFDLKEEVIIKLKLTTYKYNYNNYLDDLLKFRPKVVNQTNEELNNNYKEF